MKSPVLASRALLRFLVPATYIVTAAGGAAVLNYPPVTYVGSAATVTITWGVVLLCGGALAAVGAIVPRWRTLEWAACYLLAAGLLMYAALSWMTVPGTFGSMPRAFLITAGVLAALARGTSLAIDDWTARRAALVRRNGGSARVDRGPNG